MEDPLRPKTVPLETILWFEFLLDPSLLTAHLTKENTRKFVEWKHHPVNTKNFSLTSEPTPIELISQFLSIAPENQSNATDITSPDIESALNKNEGLKIGHKQLALKILGLKVASHLKWNLGEFYKIFIYWSEWWTVVEPKSLALIQKLSENRFQSDTHFDHRNFGEESTSTKASATT